MRAGRLLSFLLLLQTRGRMTAAELADALEVSVRTVYRDAESLGAAGVPVYSERGPAGGYRLVDGYRTHLTGMTGDEAESLFLAGVPGPAAQLGLGSVLAAAELKLLAALPPELRSRAGRIRERFHLDAPGWFHDADPVPYLAAVADAVWNQRQLRVRYLRWQSDLNRPPNSGPRQAEVERVLEPLGIVLKSGAWYLVARVSEQLRSYRVSRILALETLNERFERPEQFDLAEFWRTWSERYENSVYRGEAVARISPRGLARLPFLLGPAVTRAANETAAPDANGWLRVTLPIESVEHALSDFLRLGAEVEMLAPPELRERVAQTVALLARIYRSS